MFHEIKGHRYFLEAAAIVARSVPDAVFLIIGDGELREDLERRIRGNPLLKNVRFLGQREDVPEILRAMDVYVCASISESFSLSLLEAMASGRAIVTTDCGGPGEMIRDGSCGFVVPVGDSRAIAERIAAFLGDPSLGESFGRKAAQEAMRYDIRATVNKLESLYEKAVSPSRISESGT
jgi:glycosyltransferase involved in cell wall biosynthesis